MVSWVSRFGRLAADFKAINRVLRDFDSPIERAAVMIVLLSFVFLNEFINTGCFERIIDGVPLKFLSNKRNRGLLISNDCVHVSDRCVYPPLEFINIIDLEPMVKNSEDLRL